MAGTPACGLIATFLGLWWISPGETVDPGQAIDTTINGVYTQEQAEAGAATFASVCLSCHDVSRFSGNAFRDRWEARTVADLWGFLESAEPGAIHGSYPGDHYIGLIAYTLQLNSLPAGNTELPVDTSALEAMRIEWE